jgi:hypothetical protein
MGHARFTEENIKSNQTFEPTPTLYCIRLASECLLLLGDTF